MGYTTEAMFSYLLQLGWTANNENDFDLEKIINEFSLEKLINLLLGLIFKNLIILILKSLGKKILTKF